MKKNVLSNLVNSLMYKKGHLSAKEGDSAKYQFDDFIDNIAEKNFELFSGFYWERVILTIFMISV